MTSVYSAIPAVNRSVSLDLLIQLDAVAYIQLYLVQAIVYLLPAAMILFDLNNDVLLSIVSRLDNKSLIMFSRTCQTAYDAAIPFLLSFVRLSNNRARIISFCDYLLRHTPRIRLLRRLEIWNLTHTPQENAGPNDKILDVPVGRPLANILTRADNLEHLYLSPSEGILAAEPDIATAIMRCPRLSTLRLRGDGVLTRKVLEETGALHVLSFHLSEGGSLAPILRRSQLTLEVLHITAGVYRGVQDLNLDGTGCWHRLRELILFGRHAVSVQMLSRAFPNLRILGFIFGNEYVPSEMRVLNEQVSSSWPSLDYVFGRVNDVYNLALSSQVRELKLICHLDNQNTMTVDKFLDNVQHTTPIALTFGANPCLLNESFGRRFARSARGLHYLGLQLVDKNFVSFDQQVMFASHCVTTFHVTHNSHRAFNPFGLCQSSISLSPWCIMVMF
jgi:hypothetical protein